MNQKSENEIDIREDLVLGNIGALSDRLLISMMSAECFTIDLTLVRKIDLSGLQLLISFIREVHSLDKHLTFSGVFSDDLKKSLNSITFSPYELANGEELTRFLSDIK